jgi:hypothetical protein
VANILRPQAARRKLGVGKTKFRDFVLYDESDPYVPGTDKQVRRVRFILLGERAVGFFEDELDVLIEDLRRWRDAKPFQPPKEPKPFVEWREKVNKRRAASNKLEEIDPA